MHTLLLKHSIAILLVVAGLLYPSLILGHSSLSSDKYIDSMMHVVNTADSDTKIETLRHLAYKERQEHDGMHYINMLEQEALKQSNKQMLATACYYKADFHFFITQTDDSILYYLDEGKKIMPDMQSLDAERLLFTVRVAQGKYALALFQVKKMLEDNDVEKSSTEEAIIFSELGFIFSRLGNHEEAITAFNRCIDIANGDLTRENLELKLEALTVLGDSYISTKQYPLAIGLADSIYASIRQIEIMDKIPSGSYDRIIIFSIIDRARAYMTMGDLENARADLDAIKIRIASSTSYSLWRNYYMDEAQYYYQKGEYQRALEYINKTANEDDKEMQDATISIKHSILRGDILRKLNRNAEAYDLLQGVTLMKDSINARLMSSQVAEFQTIYDVDKIKSEMQVKATLLDRTRAIVIGLLCVVLLLLVILITIRKNRKEREEKNRKIYEQYLQLKSYLDQIRVQRNSLDNVLESKNDKAISLSQQIYNYLIDTEEFKNENLSRDELAAALGTNRQYLIDAIKEETGKTFKDYINTIRLDYAYSLLIKDWNSSIGSIYVDAGFSVRNTFNKLFKEQYGMSPNELREIARQKEEVLIQKGKALNDDIANSENADKE